MKNIILLLIIGLALTLPAYAGNNGNDSDKLSTNQSNTFSPGYLNTVKQFTAAILSRENSDKNVFDKAVEHVQNNIRNKAAENRQENNKIIPNLKGPGGGGGENVQTQVTAQALEKGLGDVNGDGTVDVDDLARLLQAYGFSKGSARYDKDADFNKDGIVNATDLTTILSYYNIVYDNKPEASKPIITAIDSYNRGRDTGANNDDRSPSDYYRTSYQDNSTTDKPQDTASIDKINAISGDDKMSHTQPNQFSALSAPANNPAEDQKILIDAIKNLLQDINNLDKKGETGIDPELAKASDNLIQVAANILLAQAIPDLLKEDEISGIKGIFTELDDQRTKIMREYEMATTPYYDKLKKDILRNVNALKLNNIVSNTLMEEELNNMPRIDIDKVVYRLKKLEKRSFEEEYVLQQESKYYKNYLDLSMKKLEEDMKGVLQNVTKRLNMTLEAVPKNK